MFGSNGKIGVGGGLEKSVTGADVSGAAGGGEDKKEPLLFAVAQRNRSAQCFMRGFAEDG